jgi:hypothetical protein
MECCRETAAVCWAPHSLAAGGLVGRGGTGLACRVGGPQAWQVWQGE